MWLAALGRVFPDSAPPLTEGVGWVEPSDAALAPVLAALWRLALATPRGEDVDKATLHAALRVALQPTVPTGGGGGNGGLRLLRDAKGAEAERKAGGSRGKAGSKSAKDKKKKEGLPKQKPNEPCRCGSGSKFKKCCGAVRLL